MPTPPQSEVSETAVVAALFRDPDVLPAVRGRLSPEDFYHHHHGLVYRQMLGLADADKPVDLASVHTALVAAGLAAEWGDSAGLVRWLTECWESRLTAADAEYHAGVVADLAARRRLIHTLSEALRDAYDMAGRPTADLLADVEQRVLRVGDRLMSGGDPVHLDAALREALERIDAKAAGRDVTPPPIRTGFEAVDQVLGGFRAGAMYVVAARPSVGKSAFAMNCLLNAGESGVRSLFLSLEMSAAELAERTLSLRASIPLGRLSAGRLEAEDEPRQLLSAAGRPTNVWVDDRPDQTPESIAAAARRAVSRHQVRLVAVDYLQLVRHGRAERHDLAVGATATSLKRLARQLNVPVVCLAQLNRQVDGRGADSKPRLSDLRDSGQIEQDADVVVFLHPGEAIHGQPVQDMELIVAKQRNGPRGEIPMSYVRPFVRFEPPVPRL